MKKNRLRRDIKKTIYESGAPKRNYRIPTSLRIVAGLLALIIMGTMLLLTPGATHGARLGLGDALFTATSAVTVTGLSTITVATRLTLFGQIILLLLIQIGGVGYMFAASLLMRLIGRKIYVLDRLALSSSIGLDSPEKILVLLKRVFLGILTIEGIGALFLYVHWSINGMVQDGSTLFYAVFHAISAFCNAGFDLFGDPTLYSGIPRDNLTLIILGLLIFLGGLGIPVLSEFVTKSRFHHMSLHTRLTLTVVFILLLLGWVFTFIAEVGATGVLVGERFDVQVIQSLFHSISSRTAGFAGFERFAELTSATQILTITLMFIGCAPASMGGGMTTGTIAVLGTTLLNSVRGHQEVQVWGRTIASETIRRATMVLTISVALVLLATFLLLLTNDLTLGEALFEVVSAFATCGLSLDVTGRLNGVGLSIIALMMIWGRLGALTIVIAFAQTTDTTRYVKYPEEQVLIG